METKKKINPFIPGLIVLSIILIVVAILCIKLLVDKNSVEQKAEEYRIANESLVLENEKEKQTAEEAAQLASQYKAAYDDLKEEVEKEKREEEEAKKREELLAVEYQNEYNILVLSIIETSALAENLGNQIISVWNNAIWEIRDNETDKYTLSNGVFVSDFNDALQNLFVEESFNQDMILLTNSQQQIKEKMKTMISPPTGFENAFNALEKLYNAYLLFTNIVIDCDGSLNSFSEAFSKADDELLIQYHAAEIYVKIN